SVYPKSMYHLFLGVYPNDEATMDVAKRLAQRHYNVHVIVNAVPGPTSKAQNINHVIKEIRKVEEQMNWRFSAFTVHDAEDVVHPYELKVTNHLIEQYPALQFPVFPIVYKPTFRNFFKNLTSGTYADEFAENHFLVVSSRNDAHAFVPSAGTGFSLSRQVVESFEGQDILDNHSLTEDYKLSLTLFQQGFPLHYVLERIPRVAENRKISWDYIATRSLFPHTYKTALRQKTRWIRGITMQSLSLKELMHLKKISFVARYSMYRDQKAKIGNLLAFIGYPVFLYFIFSMFYELPTIYPKGSLSWSLSLLVTLMMIERQIFRAIAIFNIYGLRSVFFASLLPPGIPIRTIWGNFINFSATIRAYYLQFFNVKASPVKKNKKAKAAPAPHWDKTEHHFLSPATLKRYQRRLGDALLEKEVLTPNQLKDHLQAMEQLHPKPLLGQYLWDQKVLSATQLLHCFADTLHKVYIESESATDYPIPQITHPFSLDQLREYQIVPIMQNEHEMVLAFGIESPMGVMATLQEKSNVRIEACFANQQFIEDGLRRLQMRSVQEHSLSTALRLYQQEKIHFEQVVLIHNAMLQTQQDEHYVMECLGVQNQRKAYHEEANELNQPRPNLVEVRS
ncbi:MAG: glycosyltransferase, partial [Erysipelotrichaceae bacterium]